MSERPAPLTPPECRLQGASEMPAHIERFRRSKLYFTSSDAAFRAGLALMCASWLLQPAASLPNNDRALAYYAGLGPSLRRWRNLRERALADWRLCSDGRWYHPELAAAACEAWLEQCLKAGCSALRRGRSISWIVSDVTAALDHVGASRSRTVTRARAWLSRHALRAFEDVPVVFQQPGSAALQ